MITLVLCAKMVPLLHINPELDTFESTIPLTMLLWLESILQTSHQLPLWAIRNLKKPGQEQWTKQEDDDRIPSHGTSRTGQQKCVQISGNQSGPRHARVQQQQILRVRTQRTRKPAASVHQHYQILDQEMEWQDRDTYYSVSRRVECKQEVPGHNRCTCCGRRGSRLVSGVGCPLWYSSIYHTT